MKKIMKKAVPCIAVLLLLLVAYGVYFIYHEWEL
jgi:hypothetical protein